MLYVPVEQVKWMRLFSVPATKHRVYMASSNPGEVPSLRRYWDSEISVGNSYPGQ
jgi:hypothetical protein